MEGSKRQAHWDEMGDSSDDDEEEIIPMNR